MFFELGDEAGTDGIEAGEEAAPDMPVAPEIFAGGGVDDGEIGIADWRGFYVIGDRIFGDAAVLIDRASLATREEHIATAVWVGGEKKNEVGLRAIGDDLEFLPFFQTCQGFGADAVGASFIEEVDGFGVEDTRRAGELLLREGGRGGEEEGKSEKRGDETHVHLRMGKSIPEKGDWKSETDSKRGWLPRSLHSEPQRARLSGRDDRREAG